MRANVRKQLDKKKPRKNPGLRLRTKIDYLFGINELLVEYLAVTKEFGNWLDLLHGKQCEFARQSELFR